MLPPKNKEYVLDEHMEMRIVKSITSGSELTFVNCHCNNRKVFGWVHGLADGAESPFPSTAVQMLATVARDAGKGPQGSVKHDANFIHPKPTARSSAIMTRRSTSGDKWQRAVVRASIKKIYKERRELFLSHHRHF